MAPRARVLDRREADTASSGPTGPRDPWDDLGYDDLTWDELARILRGRRVSVDPAWPREHLVWLAEKGT